LAVARFEHRCATLILEDFHAHSAAHDVADAAAVYRWLTQRPGIDPARIGVLGHCLGAIAATALARHAPRIERLCLLSATTASHLATRLAAGNGSAPKFDSHQVPSSYGPSLANIDSAAEAAFHDRPTLIVHGAADRFITPKASRELVGALESAGRAVEHVLIARGDHGFTTPATRRACVDRISRFFVAMMVRQPEAAVAPSAT
jgi:dienelactone hydrolase